MWLQNIFISIFVLIIILVLTYNHLLKLQYNIIYNPKSSFIWHPTNEDIEFEDIYIPINNLKKKNKGFLHPPNINCWFFKNDMNNRDGYENNTILFAHGSFGNMSYYKHMVKMCQTIGYNLMLFDYRGYGKSSGRTSQKNILIDGKIVYEELIKKVPPDKIIIWGESLGGAVATEIAKEYIVKKVILFSTFSSLDDIMRYHNSSIFTNTIASVAEILTNTLPSKNIIQYVEEPILIIHSKNDKKIPYKCAEILYEKISPNTSKLMLTIDGDHTTPIITYSNVEKIIKFIDPNISSTNSVPDITLFLNSLSLDHFKSDNNMDSREFFNKLCGP